MKNENFLTTGPLFGTVERYFCRVEIGAVAFLPQDSCRNSCVFTTNEQITSY